MDHNIVPQRIDKGIPKIYSLLRIFEVPFLFQYLFIAYNREINVGRRKLKVCMKKLPLRKANKNSTELIYTGVLVLHLNLKCIRD